MKIFLPFLLLIVSLSAFGQFSSSLDCVGAMNIGYRYINPHKSDVPSGFVDIRNKEQVGLRADFGLNFNKKFGSKLYFKTGLRMANKGYNSYKLNTLVKMAYITQTFQPVAQRTRALNLNTIISFWKCLL